MKLSLAVLALFGMVSMAGAVDMEYWVTWIVHQQGLKPRTLVKIFKDGDGAGDFISGMGVQKEITFQSLEAICPECPKCKELTEEEKEQVLKFEQLQYICKPCPECAPCPDIEIRKSNAPIFISTEPVTFSGEYEIKVNTGVIPPNLLPNKKGGRP